MSEFGPKQADLQQGEADYEQDKNKAEELAYAEKPYAIVVENARKAAAAGVKGMESVYVALAQKRDKAVADAGVEYDKTREKIEDLKLTIAKRICNFELPAKNLPESEKECRGMILRISSGPGRRPDVESEDRWILELPKDDQEEIMDTTYGLLGAKRPDDNELHKARSGVRMGEVTTYSESLGRNVSFFTDDYHGIAGNVYIRDRLK